MPTGRHHAVSPDLDLGTGVIADTPETATDSAPHLPAQRSSGTGSHRVPEEQPDEPVSSEGARPDDTRHDDTRPEDTGASATPHADASVIEIDREVATRRSSVRRLAPLGIGGAAVLAAALVFTTLQPGSQAPDLNSALVNDGSRRASSDVSQVASSASNGEAGSRTLSEVTQGASDQIGTAVAAEKAAERRKAQQAAAAAAAESSSDDGDDDEGSGSDAPSGSGQAPAPLAAVAGAAQVAGEGVQTALKQGWSALGGDEFTGAGLGSNWSAYDGPGHDGQGRRTPDAVSMQDGNLVIRGDSEGNTGGISWGEGQQYGKWEVRAKFPKGDKQYHPVLLLWPDSGQWPEGGEIDFAETNSAADDVSFFLHYGSDNSQESAKKALDITQWHNYAVSWTPEGITGYVDGVQFFQNTDSSTQPPGPMHPTIQLDYFPDGGSPEPSEMQVAWMRQYK
ncbi:glycoside hydrolase family 16 protein [Pseudonocardia sp. KRD291]|uniref:glycoside hydrolase family 16 protein n=1 Tax=Pseudonocardia sp. KRD291 TaxID=2792007 RepID=UPI001C4A0A7B|nr:glycoside hydrolase family 16 protein [Pseudonocardia sp. KRD291]MBW0103677.1 glycoside hydrolase family 16 protein [Pseudonocardia sp. KRD291]